MDSEQEISIELMELADIGHPIKIAYELHRQLREQFGSVPIPLPLPALAKAVGIAGIREFETETFEGTLVIQDGVGAIGLRRGLRPGRRNFTLGHEIGHFLIPSHRLLRTRFECMTSDINRQRASANWESAPPLERIEMQANEFSAALLVPTTEFKRELRRLGRGCDLAHVRQLADIFGVSQEMMAQVYVDAADEKIAIVTSRNDAVRRVIPGGDFPYLGLRRGAPVPADALTRAYRRTADRDATSELREIPTHIWLDRRGRVEHLYEQALVQDDGWAMTLLCVDEDDEDDDGDEDHRDRRLSRRWS